MRRPRAGVAATNKTVKVAGIAVMAFHTRMKTPGITVRIACASRQCAGATVPGAKIAVHGAGSAVIAILSRTDGSGTGVKSAKAGMKVIGTAVKTVLAERAAPGNGVWLPGAAMQVLGTKLTTSQTGLRFCYKPLQVRNLRSRLFSWSF